MHTCSTSAVRGNVDDLNSSITYQQQTSARATSPLAPSLTSSDRQHNRTHPSQNRSPSWNFGSTFHSSPHFTISLWWKRERHFVISDEYIRLHVCLCRIVKVSETAEYITKHCETCSCENRVFSSFHYILSASVFFFTFWPINNFATLSLLVTHLTFMYNFTPAILKF